MRTVACRQRLCCLTFEIVDAQVWSISAASSALSSLSQVVRIQQGAVSKIMVVSAGYSINQLLQDVGLQVSSCRAVVQEHSSFLSLPLAGMGHTVSHSKECRSVTLPEGTGARACALGLSGAAQPLRRACAGVPGRFRRAPRAAGDAAGHGPRGPEGPGRAVCWAPPLHHCGPAELHTQLPADISPVVRHGGPATAGELVMRPPGAQQHLPHHWMRGCMAVAHPFIDFANNGSQAESTHAESCTHAI